MATSSSTSWIWSKSIQLLFCIISFVKKALSVRVTRPDPRSSKGPVNRVVSLLIIDILKHFIELFPIIRLAIDIYCRSWWNQSTRPNCYRAWIVWGSLSCTSSFIFFIVFIIFSCSLRRLRHILKRLWLHYERVTASVVIHYLMKLFLNLLAIRV